MRTNTLHSSPEFEQYPAQRTSQPIDRRAATMTGLAAAVAVALLLALQTPVVVVLAALIALVMLVVAIERATDAVLA